MDTKLRTLAIKTFATACFIFGIISNTFSAVTWICGSYTGNGSTQSISGLGFDPEAVIIKSSGNTTAFIKTSYMTGTNSRGFSSTGGFVTNAITGFGTAAFSIGANAGVNTNGTVYYFYAFKSSNVVKIGTYTGNGSANRNVASTGGANTKFVIIIPETTYGGSVWYSHNNSAAGYSYDDGSPTSAFTTSPPIAPPTNGFSTYSGADPRSNQNLIVYHYIGFVEAGGECEVNAYTGNSVNNRTITGLGLKPYFILSTGGNTAILARSRSLTGDATQYFSATSNASGLIKSFQNSGYTVGNDASVNNNIFNQTYITLGGASGGILPIELLHFDVQRLPDKKILINWSTATEENNSHFTIEESEDGISFEPVGEVEGAGNSAERVNYQFMHETTREDIVLYYRLKQTDYNGTSKTFQMIALPVDETKPEFEVSIAQNPVTNNELIYDVNLPDATTLNVKIIDNLGIITSTMNYYHSRGMNHCSLTINNLKSGVYTLSVTDLTGGTKKSIRFVVSN